MKLETFPFIRELFDEFGPPVKQDHRSMRFEMNRFYGAGLSFFTNSDDIHFISYTKGKGMERDLHRDDQTKPAYIAFDRSGQVVREVWYCQGKMIREKRAQ
jgi:hypothetical protein